MADTEQRELTPEEVAEFEKAQYQQLMSFEPFLWYLSKLEASRNSAKELLDVSTFKNLADMSANGELNRRLGYYQALEELVNEFKP